MVKKTLFYTLGCLGMATFTAMVSSPSQAGAIQWYDTYVSYRYVPDNAQPGFNTPAPENAVNISYANGWTYGSNFVNIDFEAFSKQDQANVAGTSYNGKYYYPNSTSGSAEVYAIFQTVLSANKISGTKTFEVGPLEDLGLTIRGEFDTQNDQFASFKKMAIVGPNFAFNVPKGFFNVTVGVGHEWNTDAYLPYGNGTDYDATLVIDTAWDIPFKVANLSFDFTGYTSLVSPKGSGATGDFKHREEFLAHPKLLLDIGELISYEPGKIQAGIGYEYWLNKFGGYSSAIYPYAGGKNGNGTRESSLFFEIGYHFH